MLTALLGDDPSLVPLKQVILSKTEGNPFFMEEVVQTLAEENALLGQPGNYRIERVPLAIYIPTTVQGVLAARIDRLPVPQKELLQTLAVIGTEFPSSLIRRVTGQHEEELLPLLVNLQTGDFIYERPTYPEVEYSFKHALTQEVAGNSLLSGQRSILHERAAQAIEALFPERLKEYCNELAHHYSQSGNVPKAVEYLQLAGKQALQRSAQLEAIGHLSLALVLLKTMPDTPERAREELTLLLTLGPAWMAARSHGAHEVEVTYTRALELCEQVGNEPLFFSAQYGLWSFYLMRAQLYKAHALAEQLLGLAEKTQEPEQLAEAHRLVATTVLRLGDMTQARAHVEQALVLHNPNRTSYSNLLRYARNPSVHMRSTLGRVLWYLGFPDQARARCDEALMRAKQASDPFALALALIYAAELHERLHDIQLAREYADAAISLSSDQGFPLYLAWGEFLHGWTLVEQGSHAAGIAQMHQGLNAHEATGAILERPTLLELLADAYGKAGQPEEGLGVLTGALALAHETGERFDEPMLLRLKGELIAALLGDEGKSSARAGEAEECLQNAMAIAHNCGVRSLELHAGISLARLWRRWGKPDAARAMLAGIHATFTEGFDTSDWQEAKAILDD